MVIFFEFMSLWGEDPNLEAFMVVWFTQGERVTKKMRQRGEKNVENEQKCAYLYFGPN